MIRAYQYFQSNVHFERLGQLVIGHLRSQLIISRPINLANIAETISTSTSIYTVTSMELLLEHRLAFNGYFHLLFRSIIQQQYCGLAPSVQQEKHKMMCCCNSFIRRYGQPISWATKVVLLQKFHQNIDLVYGAFHQMEPHHSFTCQCFHSCSRPLIGYMNQFCINGAIADNAAPILTQCTLFSQLKQLASYGQFTIIFTSKLVIEPQSKSFAELIAVVINLFLFAIVKAFSPLTQWATWYANRHK